MSPPPLSLQVNFKLIQSTGHFRLQILEFMEGGDLLRLIQREKFLSVDSSRFYFLQLCQAVKHLHDQNITHRDIKPGKIEGLTNLRYNSLTTTTFFFTNFRKYSSARRRRPNQSKVIGFWT